MEAVTEGLVGVLVEDFVVIADWAIRDDIQLVATQRVPLCHPVRRVIKLELSGLLQLLNDFLVVFNGWNLDDVLVITLWDDDGFGDAICVDAVLDSTQHGSTGVVVPAYIGGQLFNLCLEDDAGSALDIQTELGSDALAEGVFRSEHGGKHHCKCRQRERNDNDK